MPRKVIPTIYEQLPPRNIDAEEALIACLLTNPESFLEVQGVVEKGHFFRDTNGLIFDACMSLYKSGQDVNIISVNTVLGGKSESVGGITFLTDCIQRCPSVIGGRFYAETIRDSAISRHLLSELHGVSKLLFEGENPIKLRDQIMAMIASVTTGVEGSSDVSVGDVIRGGLQTEMEEWIKNPSKIRGHSTGYRRLDYMIDGLHGGSVMAIVADSGVGKSQFCYNIALNLAKMGVPVSIISTEMPDKQLTRRLIFLDANVNSVAVLKRNPKELFDDEILRLRRATPRVESLPIYPSFASTLPAVESEIFRKKLVFGTNVAIIDHIQHIGVPGVHDETVAIETTMKAIKDLAVKHDIAIIVVSHVSREAIKAGKISLDYAKRSSSIKQDIDVGLTFECFETTSTGGSRLLNREEVNKRVADNGGVDVRIYGEKVRDGMGHAIEYNLSWDAGGQFREW